MPTNLWVARFSSGRIALRPVTYYQFSATIEDQYFRPVEPFQIGDQNAYLEQLNAMNGGIWEFGGNSVLQFGYAVPLTSNPVSGFRCNFSYYFGRSSRRNTLANRLPVLLSADRFQGAMTKADPGRSAFLWLSSTNPSLGCGSTR